MTFFGASDLPAMLEDAGVPIVWGVNTGKGLVDIVDRELLSDASANFTGTVTQVTAETAKFGTITVREEITVDGAPYVVLQARRIGDGALVEIWCTPDTL